MNIHIISKVDIQLNVMYLYNKDQDNIIQTSHLQKNILWIVLDLSPLAIVFQQ